MRTTQSASVSLPFPSRWGLDSSIAGRPVVRGIFTINSVSGNTVTGTANFRGTPLPIQGTWDKSTNVINFDTPFATFSGRLDIFDDAGIKVRHHILSGRLRMKPPSLQAGEFGNWIATTDTPLTGPATQTVGLPPVGVFTTSDLLYHTGGRS